MFTFVFSGFSDPPEVLPEVEGGEAHEEDEPPRFPEERTLGLLWALDLLISH